MRKDGSNMDLDSARMFIKAKSNDIFLQVPPLKLRPVSQSLLGQKPIQQKVPRNLQPKVPHNLQLRQKILQKAARKLPQILVKRPQKILILTTKVDLAQLELLSLLLLQHFLCGVCNEPELRNFINVVFLDRTALWCRDILLLWVDSWTQHTTSHPQHNTRESVFGSK